TRSNKAQPGKIKMIHNHPKIKVAAAHAAPVYLDTNRTVDKACSLIAEAARHGAKLIAFPETSIPAFPVWTAHAAPVYLDTNRTVDKACSLIAEAARHGAKLIAFPETFIPAFPVWTAVAAPILTHELFKALASSAIAVDGPEMLRIRDAARRHQIIVSIGFNEGTQASVGCIWNSNALIGEDGTLLNHHRKLVPTYYEKLVWSNGDGAGLRVVETPVGRIGIVICGENPNTLPRYTMMARGEETHI